eukprot:gb/GEZN01002837.1/.p1 GENE.gb/GEZN01002837.1/~~gb/GEZN01002837.1/.p1  ORF type:complete len:592 (+),score=97.57 gb/GEZN01002837.1/:229-2004(+)
MPGESESKGAGQGDLSALPLSVIILGATGDLARKKLFPALYQLLLMKRFPEHTNIVGYGRSPVDLEKFLSKQCENVVYQPKLSKEEFFSRISFHAGAYDSASSFEELHTKLKKNEKDAPGNRLYFLSIPPFVFGEVCKRINEYARATKGGWTHCIIEKPFGKDSESYEVLHKITSSNFQENELYRIDHYLGKEVVLNLMTLRFANQIFEPVWNREHIDSVEITFKEDIGTGGRGGYFDDFGIIRDVMQNHLLQVFMFMAMEPPAAMEGNAITAAKVQLLKSVQTLTLAEGTFLGQFAKNTWIVNGVEHNEPGYLDDSTVPKGSRCPTFAAVVLKVDTDRWRGVPFLMKAGKGLDERVVEVRVRFKTTQYNKLMMKSPKSNEFVMRVQPDEALYLKTFSKEPGLETVVKATVMDMRYATQFKGAYIGDAYERMFLNAAKGDGSLFVSSAELQQSWRIFTPLLHEIDKKKPEVVLYPFGSRSPAGFDDWSHKVGVPQKHNWQEYIATIDSEALEVLFKKLDKDKDGALDEKEVGQLAKMFYDGREPTDFQINKIFAQLDNDKDGRITLQELMEGAQSLYRAFGVPYCLLDHNA